MDWHSRRELCLCCDGRFVDNHSDEGGATRTSPSELRENIPVIPYQLIGLSNDALDLMLLQGQTCCDCETLLPGSCSIFGECGGCRLRRCYWCFATCAKNLKLVDSRAGSVCGLGPSERSNGGKMLFRHLLLCMKNAWEPSSRAAVLRGRSDRPFRSSEESTHVPQQLYSKQSLFFDSFRSESR